MRILRISLDGFGALRSLDIELGEGLTVLAGPNEAGKSTLLSFCRAVLFGFPRRGSPGFGLPVRGGRHGGSLTVADEAGDLWTIERYAAPIRSLVVHRPDGRPGGEAELRHLLGGASQELFTAVFAVDLDGLASVRSVSSDEVREALFTSAVLGQRRSASKALGELQAERQLLARPRQQDAKANLLVSELQAVRAELVEARKLAGSHGETRLLLAEIEADRERLRSAERCLAERAADLDDLQRLWERASAGRDASDQLADLPPLDPRLKRLLEYEDELRTALTGWSGHLERLSQRDRLGAQLSGVMARVASSLSSLGGAMTEEDALAVRHDVVTRESLRTIQAVRQGLAGRLDEGRATLERAGRDHDSARHAGGSPGPDQSIPIRPAPAPAEELETRSRTLAELRRRLADRSALAAAVQHDEERPAPTAAAIPRALVLMLAAVGLLALGLAGLGVTTKASAALSAGCFALALVALLAAALLGQRALAPDRKGSRRLPRRSGSDAGEDPDPESEPARRRRQLSDLDARIAALATSLGLGPHPTASDVEVEAGRVEDDWAARRSLDQAEEQLARTREAVAAASEAARRLEAQLAECDADFIRWKQAARLPDDFGIAAASEALELAAQLQDDIAARLRIEAALRALDGQIGAYTDSLEKLAADLYESLPGSTVEQEAWLGRLSARLEECRQLAIQRTTLEEAATRAEGEVAHLLGSGDRAERLRDELEHGSLLAWESEKERIRAELADLRAEEEGLVRRHEAARRELDQLLSSDRLARLEAREAELEAELDAVLRRYAVLGCARSLISSTLARHESERQPAVLRRAGDHFRSITAGRYERVLVDPSDASRPVVRAVSARGESLDAADLSRGTAEQLYLSLRLGLAEEFAERSVALPIVLDDVLVNFDEERARAVVKDLAETASRRQVLIFTCHPHLVRLVEQTRPGASVVQLEQV